MPGFWDDLGKGLQDAGAILSPTVYQSQEQERHLAIKQKMAVQEQNRALVANAIMSGAAPASAGQGLGLPAGLGPDAQTQIKLQQQQIDKQASEVVSPFLDGKDYQGALSALAKIPGGMRSSVATELMRVINSQIRAPQAQGQRPFAVGGSVAIPDQQTPGGIRFMTPPQDQQKPPKTSTFSQELTDAGLKPGTPEWDAAWKKRLARETAPTSTMINLSSTGNMSQDALTLAADQYLAGDATAAQGYARSPAMRSQLQNKIAERAKEMGLNGKDIAMAVAEFQGIKSGERTLGTRQAQIELAGNVVSQFVPIAKAASDAFKRSNIKSLNDLQIAVQSRTSSPELRRLNASVNAVVNAYGRAINPSGVGNEADKAEARKILQSAFSTGDFDAAAEQIMLEIGQEMKAPGEVKAGMREFFKGGKPGTQTVAPPAGFKPL